MNKYAKLVGLTLAMLVTVSVAGCSKRQGVTNGAQQPGGVKQSGPAAVIMDIRQRQSQITSYVQVIDGYAGNVSRWKVKLQDGTPVRMKMDSTQSDSWTLLQFDKKMAYEYNGSTNMVTSESLSGENVLTGILSAPMGSRLPDPNAEMLPKISSDRIDNVDCWCLDSGDFGRVWYDKVTGLLKLTESGQMVTKNTYEQINAVPDSEFELPPGARVQAAPAATGQ